MKVSYDWLKSMVELPEDPSELSREFIRTGGVPQYLFREIPQRRWASLSITS